MKFKRTKLSDGCKRNLQRLLERKNIHTDATAIFKEIEDIMAIINQMIEKKQQAIASAMATKQRRQRISQLISILKVICSDAMTMERLRQIYLMSYPMPPPSPPGNRPRTEAMTHVLSVLSQKENTHLVRMDERGKIGLPVRFDEPLSRVLRTLERFEKTFHPRRGARPDRDKIFFVMYLLHYFETLTNTQATATPNGFFDEFLGYILEDTTDDAPGQSRRKLIQAGMKEREELEPVDREFVEVATTLESKFGHKKATLIMNRYLFPEEAASLERKLEYCAQQK
jgi:hypothetical protein